jgi:O-antigen ligase
LSERILFLPVIAFGWMILSAFWALSTVNALKLNGALGALTCLGILGTSAMMQIPFSQGQILKKRLYQGALGGCGSLVFEIVSHGITFKFLGLGNSQISYYNQGITLIVMFFCLFFHEKQRTWVFWLVYASLLASSFFFDYDAGLLGLGLMPLFLMIFSKYQKSMIKFMMGCVVAVILTGPLIPKYILNYDIWRQNFSEQNDPSWLHRLKIWSYVSGKIEQKPLKGWGLNSSRHELFQVIDKWEVPGVNEKAPKEIKYTPAISLHPHNMTLQIWLEIGGIGALIMAFIMTCIGRFLWGNNLTPALKRTLSTVFAITFFFAHLSYGFWQSWWFAALGFIFIWGTLLRIQESNRHEN